MKYATRAIRHGLAHNPIRLCFTFCRFDIFFFSTLISLTFIYLGLYVSQFYCVTTFFIL
jgi:hypothetical protein